MSTLTATPSCAPVIVQFTHNVCPSSLQCAGGWTGKGQSATTYCICICTCVSYLISVFQCLRTDLNVADVHQNDLSLLPSHFNLCCMNTQKLRKRKTKQHHTTQDLRQLFLRRKSCTHVGFKPTPHAFHA